jgi:hypothetical protein
MRKFFANSTSKWLLISHIDDWYQKRITLITILLVITVQWSAMHLELQFDQEKLTVLSTEYVS